MRSISPHWRLMLGCVPNAHACGMKVRKTKEEKKWSSDYYYYYIFHSFMMVLYCWPPPRIEIEQKAKYKQISFRSDPTCRYNVLNYIICCFFCPPPHPLEYDSHCAMIWLVIGGMHADCVCERERARYSCGIFAICLRTNILVQRIIVE